MPLTPQEQGYLNDLAGNLQIRARRERNRRVARKLRRDADKVVGGDPSAVEYHGFQYAMRALRMTMSRTPNPRGGLFERYAARAIRVIIKTRESSGR